VRPSDFAVFKLITSSNLVACSTGRSAGLVVNVCRRVAVIRGEVSAVAKQPSRDQVLAQRTPYCVALLTSRPGVRSVCAI